MILIVREGKNNLRAFPDIFLVSTRDFAESVNTGKTRGGPIHLLALEFSKCSRRVRKVRRKLIM